MSTIGAEPRRTDLVEPPRNRRQIGRSRGPAPRAHGCGPDGPIWRSHRRDACLGAMRPPLLRRIMTLAAAFAACAFIVPSIELATSTAASAAGYPDVAAEPVPFGDAAYLGSMAGVQLNAPVVGM